MPDVPADLPLNRASDQGRAGRVRAFWHKWGDLISGVWLILVSIAVLIVAISFYTSQSRTQHSAQEGCLRSKRFGPALANAYAKYHILSDQPGPHGQPSELDAYRASIPSTCP